MNTNDSSPVSTDAPVVYWNGQWQSHSGTSLPLDDLGFLQGSVLVERLRTVRGQVLDAPQHLNRLHDGIAAFGLPAPSEWSRLADLLQQCADRNWQARQSEDHSIVLLVTPGSHSKSDPWPNVLIHSASIAWPRLKHWFEHGQVLFVSQTCNVPEACWAPQIKTRARLQYYLADREAEHFQFPSTLPNVLFPAAILPDIGGRLTETATANLLLVEGKCLVSPPLEAILHGVSLDRTLRLARSAGYSVCFEPIESARALAADEVLLCGTTACLGRQPH